MNESKFLDVVRSLLMTSSVYLVAAWFSVTGAIVGRICGREALLLHLQKFWDTVCGAMRRFGSVHVRFEGGYSDDANTAVLYLPTHESILDGFLFHFLGRPAYIARESLFKIILFGYCMRCAGMIPINRERPDVRRLIRDVREAFAQGRQVIFFPEGTRTLHGQHTNVLPGTSIVVKIAHDMGVPIVPVTVASGQSWGPPKTLGRGLPVDLVVRIGKPLDLAPILSNKKRDFHEALTALMRKSWGLLEGNAQK